MPLFVHCRPSPTTDRTSSGQKRSIDPSASILDEDLSGLRDEDAAWIQGKRDELQPLKQFAPNVDPSEAAFTLYFRDRQTKIQVISKAVTMKKKSIGRRAAGAEEFSAALECLKAEVEGVVSFASAVLAVNPLGDSLAPLLDPPCAANYEIWSDSHVQVKAIKALASDNVRHSTWQQFFGTTLLIAMRVSRSLPALLVMQTMQKLIKAQPAGKAPYANLWMFVVVHFSLRWIALFTLAFAYIC